MRKNLKIAMAVAVVAVIAGAGIYEAYILSAPPAPCAGVITPSGPSGTSSSSRAAAATGTQDFARAQAALTATLPRSETTPPGEDRASDGKTTGSASILIPVVAAENFWGSLVSQLGGTHVSVTSIITDPNTDPHEYQSNDSDAIAIKDAQYVILNNVGYDDWASALVAADGTPNQNGPQHRRLLGGPRYRGHRHRQPAHVVQSDLRQPDRRLDVSQPHDDRSVPHRILHRAVQQPDRFADRPLLRGRSHQAPVRRNGRCFDREHLCLPRECD